MRVIHSILNPDDLASLVGLEYEIPAPVAATLLRRGFNDTYRARDAVGRLYALRVYSRDKYWISSDSDLLFELELLNHLAERGVRVARPLRRRDHEWLGSLEAPEGRRCFALFTYAEGSPPGERLNLDLRRTLGAEIGRLHQAMDGFPLKEGRYDLNLDLLVSIPLAAIEAYVDAGQASLFAELQDVAKDLTDHIRGLQLPQDAYGLIHGDIHFSNLHVSPAGDLMLFDFDHCGFGWRAYDLTNVCHVTESASQEEREAALATLEGYESVRKLSDAERESLPVFAACRILWDTGDMLRAAHWQGDSWATPSLCERTLSRVRSVLGPVAS